ncbi:MAG: LD-carboxypeptidase [Treponema sp.]|nr:LD-carboxypeptidase [Treponema sp.]
MKNITTPPFLSKTGTIGITAPSFGCTIEPYISRFKEALRQFEALGYKFKIGQTVYKNDGLGISTDPEVAAKELVDFYCDPGVDIIISAGGGELMCETLSHIDFSRIKKAPAKWFMGYSDNTNFIFPLVTGYGVKAIYGPNITGFGKPWEEPEIQSLELLQGKSNKVCGYKLFISPEEEKKQEEENPCAPYKLTQEKKIKIFPPVLEDSYTLITEGILIGGCLDVLANLAGTAFDFVEDFNKKHKKVIWLLEACDLSPMGIRRALWQLKEAGWFNKAVTFIFGRPYAAWGQEMMGVDQYNAITDILKAFAVPIIMDVDVGHTSPSMPLIMGANTSVTVKEGNIFFDFEL